MGIMNSDMTMRRIFYHSFRTWLPAGLLSLVCLAASAEFVQEEEKEREMSSSGLLAEAGRLLEQQAYDAATPFLVKYIDRMKSLEDDRVQAMVQDVRFKLARINMHLGDSNAATAYLNDYLAGQPVYRRRKALKWMAIGYFEISEFEKSISTVTTAFAPPPVVDESKTKKKVKIEALSKEDRGGISERRLRRYEEEAEEAGDLFGELSDEEPEEEPEYTLEERVLLNLTLAESYTALEDWSQSLESYQFVVENALRDSRRGYAGIQQIRSLVELKEFDRVRIRIYQLRQMDAHFDLRVHVALMEVASVLFNAEEYDSALMLYRMVRPREELADHHLARLNALRGAVGLPELAVTLSTNVSDRVETLLGRKLVEVSLENSSSGTGLGDARTTLEMVELEETIHTVWSLPRYEEKTLYHIGQLYTEADRPWEALGTFDRVFALDSDGDFAASSFCGALQVLLAPLEEYDRLEIRALAFLDEHTAGLYPRQTAYLLGAAYQKQERMKDVKTLRPFLERFDPSTDPLDLQYEAELWYMQALADLMLLNYKEARDGFAQVLRDYPDTRQKDNLVYWHAMSQLFLQEYQKALEELNAYQAEFPDGIWEAEPWFYAGICLFALEDYDLAMQRFTQVIDRFPVSSVYPDSCSMRGDLFAAAGKLNDAQRDYEEAIATARTPKQDSYAVFQMAAMFELEERYDEIVSVVSAYLERQGDTADVAKAAYWMGKTKLQQGLIREAVDIYCKTIVDYGGDLHQDGVDRIITELISVSRRLDEEELDPLKEHLTSALTVAESITLKLRLRVLLARMEGSELELGIELLDELEDLMLAPPPVLSLICSASFARKDYSRAEEILTLFLNHFEESDSIRAAYKLRAFDLDSKGESVAALKIVNEVQGLYGTDSDAAWAQLMKGRLEVEQGNLDAARKTFRAVFNVRSWRGEAYAEAAYSLGELEEKAGDLKQAFAWHQRTYSQYKAHAKGFWAAESYLASARVLNEMGRADDVRNTYRAMLFDPYVNTLLQAETAQAALGADEVLDIQTWIATGGQTNVTVTIGGVGE